MIKDVALKLASFEEVEDDVDCWCPLLSELNFASLDDEDEVLSSGRSSSMSLYFSIGVLALGGLDNVSVWTIWVSLWPDATRGGMASFGFTTIIS